MNGASGTCTEMGGLQDYLKNLKWRRTSRTPEYLKSFSDASLYVYVG